jgi:hypothetical protein
LQIISAESTQYSLICFMADPILCVPLQRFWPEQVDDAAAGDDAATDDVAGSCLARR